MRFSAEIGRGGAFMATASPSLHRIHTALESHVTLSVTLGYVVGDVSLGSDSRY